MLGKLGEIQELLEKAIKNKKSESWVDLGTLTRPLAKLYTEKTGIDFTNYKRVITADAIRHIRSTHGKLSKDKNKIGDDEFLLLPFILANPDKIVKSVKRSGRNRLEVIKTYKKIGAEYVFVEEVRNSRGKLAVVSFYKK